MNPVEAKQVWQAAFAVTLLGVFVICYVMGGRGHKWIRRWAGGFIFALGCCLLAVWSGVSHWLMLLAIPAYPATLSLGYGGTTTATKVKRRALYGLAVGASSGPLLLPLGLWWPFVYQVLLAVFTSVFYGLTNPTSAVGEESVVSLGLVCTVPFLLIR